MMDTPFIKHPHVKILFPSNGRDFADNTFDGKNNVFTDIDGLSVIVR